MAVSSLDPGLRQGSSPVMKSGNVHHHSAAGLVVSCSDCSTSCLRWYLFIVPVVLNGRKQSSLAIYLDFGYTLMPRVAPRRLVSRMGMKISFSGLLFVWGYRSYHVSACCAPGGLLLELLLMFDGMMVSFEGMVTVPGGMIILWNNDQM